MMDDIENEMKYKYVQYFLPIDEVCLDDTH